MLFRSKIVQAYKSVTQKCPYKRHQTGLLNSAPSFSLLFLRSAPASTLGVVATLGLDSLPWGRRTRWRWSVRRRRRRRRNGRRPAGADPRRDLACWRAGSRATGSARLSPRTTSTTWWRGDLSPTSQHGSRGTKPSRNQGRVSASSSLPM